MNNSTNMQEDEIDLLELLQNLLRNWWLLTIGAIVGGLIFFFATTSLITPMYESSATIYVLSKTTSISAALDMTTGEQLAEDFSVIATSNPVLDGASEQIEKDTGERITRDQMKDMVTVTDNATRLLVITATSDDPETAEVVANAVAAQTSEKMAEITKTDAPTTVEEAEAAKEPSSPNVTKNTCMGIAAGLGVVLIILVLNFLMNDHIVSEEDVERYLGLPTLAIFPDIDPHETNDSKHKHKKGRTKS